MLVLKAPTIDAIPEIIIIKLNILSKAPLLGSLSTNFVNKGVWNVSAVLDTSINTLKTANVTAIFPVLTPTNLTEYANVPINEIIKFNTKTVIICLSNLYHIL